MVCHKWGSSTLSLRSGQAVASFLRMTPILSLRGPPFGPKQSSLEQQGVASSAYGLLATTR